MERNNKINCKPKQCLNCFPSLHGCLTLKIHFKYEILMFLTYAHQNDQFPGCDWRSVIMANLQVTKMSPAGKMVGRQCSHRLKGCDQLCGAPGAGMPKSSAPRVIHFIPLQDCSFCCSLTSPYVKYLISSASLKCNIVLLEFSFTNL